MTSQSRGENDTELHVYSLVVTGRYLKLAEENVCIAKIAVGPPLCRLIPKLFSNKKTLQKGKTAGRKILLVNRFKENILSQK